jgi:hypothetical protein
MLKGIRILPEFIQDSFEGVEGICGKGELASRKVIYERHELPPRRVYGFVCYQFIKYWIKVDWIWVYTLDATHFAALEEDLVRRKYESSPRKKALLERPTAGVPV